jgi:hypothetical protein
MSPLVGSLRRHAARAFLVLAVLAPVAVAPLATSDAAGASALVTGTYSGKDTQGYSLSVGVAPANSASCDYNRGTHAANRYCLYMSSSQQVYIALKCPSGGGGNDYLSLFSQPLATNLTFVQSQKSYTGTTVSAILHFHLSIAHGVAKGSFVQTQADDNAPGAKWCTSGTVDFTLHHH